MLADDAGADRKDAGQRRRPDIHFSYYGEGMLMLRRMFGLGAALTAALILSAPLAHAAGHGGGGHGGGHGGGGHGGGHGGGGHWAGGHGGGGFHSSSFHSASAWHGGSGWHSGSTWHNGGSWHHGSAWHGNNFHHGFHNDFHHGHHHGNNFEFALGLGWPFWGGYYGGWGGYGGYYGGGYYPYYDSYPVYYDQPYYDYSYVPTYTVPRTYQIITQPGSMPYADDGSGGSSRYQRPGTGITPSPDGTYPYDGGPRVPVPMPHPDTAPKGKSVEPDGTTVAQIAARPKYMYPAYGEGSIDVAKTKTPTDKQTVKKSNDN
jgi:hypothetical protein